MLDIPMDSPLPYGGREWAPGHRSGLPFTCPVLLHLLLLLLYFSFFSSFSPLRFILFIHLKISPRFFSLVSLYCSVSAPLVFLYSPNTVRFHARTLVLVHRRTHPYIICIGFARVRTTSSARVGTHMSRIPTV